MAVNVQMSDDIRKYETKTVGPFTTRQLVCILIAFAYSIPIGILLPISISNKILVITFLAAPVILCGYVKMDGTNFETLVIRYIYTHFLTPPKRKYISPISFREQMTQQEERLKKERIKKMSPEKKKAFLEKEKKKKKKIVTYSDKAQFKIYH